jgi:hypothetical protein
MCVHMVPCAAEASLREKSEQDALNRRASAEADKIYKQECAARVGELAVFTAPWHTSFLAASEMLNALTSAWNALGGGGLVQRLRSAQALPSRS